MDSHEKEREELRKVQAIFEKAVENNSIEDIRPYTDEQFSYVSFTDREFNNFDDFCKQWKLTRQDIVGSGQYATRLEPQPSLFFDDIAVCSGNSKNHLQNSQGKAFDFTSHWTVVFRRNNGEWKLLRAHNSLDPFGNPMLLDTVRSKIVKLTVLAAVIGAGLGSFLTYLIS